MHRNTIFLLVGLATAISLPLATGLTTTALAKFLGAHHSAPTKASFIPENMEKKDIVVTRLIDAPIQRVWAAWTDPAEVMKWWGAKNFTSSLAKIDFRVEGSYLFQMRAPEELGGIDFFNTGTYRVIEETKIIEFTQSLSDKDGNKLERSQLGMPHDFPAEVIVKLVFKKKGTKTELTVIESGWTIGGMRAISEQGLLESLEKLEGSLATK